MMMPHVLLHRTRTRDGAVPAAAASAQAIWSMVK